MEAFPFPRGFLQIGPMELICLAFVALLVLVPVVLLLRRRTPGQRERFDRGRDTMVSAASGPTPYRREGRGVCPECGRDLPPGSPEGLCPRCLLECGLGQSAPLSVERPGTATSPYQGLAAVPSPADLAPHFPHLEILELLGHGGMGAVYKARQVKLDRLVAVKILPPEWGRDPAFAERFGREARALARLNHPHIVGVHDFGDSGGFYYLIMEYVDGVNLRQLMQASELTPEGALQIIPAVCDALEYAHGVGIVHRDIKPENLLVDRKGHVKIADFGLAKLVDRPAAAYTLTGSRQVMGTPHYMAPEQIERPLTVDHRADIYSLGVVFYEMLTGELPLGHFAMPSEKAPVDARLDKIVLRALAREPERRYQRISEVKSDLATISPEIAGPSADLALLSNRAGDDSEDVRKQVSGPAGGLIATSILNLVGLFLIFLLVTFFLAYDKGGGSPSPTWVMVVALGFVVLLGIGSGFLFLGALRMRRLESYPLAVVACVLAWLACGPAWLLGLPFGIWGLAVLTRPEVRAAFARKPGRTRGVLPRPVASPVRGKIWSLLDSVRSMFFSRPAGAVGSSPERSPGAAVEPRSSLPPIIQKTTPVPSRLPSDTPTPSAIPERREDPPHIPSPERVPSGSFWATTTPWGLLICLLGVGGTFLPWGGGYSGEEGFDSVAPMHGTLVLALFVVLGLFQIATGGLPSMGRWRAAAFLLIGVAVLGLLHQQRRFVGEGAPAPYVVGGAALVLLVLGMIEVRGYLLRDSRPANLPRPAITTPKVGRPGDRNVPGIVLCVLGLAICAAPIPWISLTIETGPGPNNMSSYTHLKLYGWQCWSGIIAGVTFLTLGLILLISRSQQPFAPLLAGLANIALVWFFMENIRDQDDLYFVSLPPKWRYWHSYPRPGFILDMCVAVILVLLGIVQTRASARRNRAMRDQQQAEEFLEDQESAAAR